MNTILVDTSVWINFFKGVETSSTLFLKANIDKFIIATCPTIVQEVLQGVISDKQFAVLESYFNGLKQLIGDQYELAREGARLYRSLRKKGVSIRKPNDCLIAAYALSSKVMLLHDDKDFLNIARYSDLQTSLF